MHKNPCLVTKECFNVTKKMSLVNLQKFIKSNLTNINPDIEPWIFKLHKP